MCLAQPLISALVLISGCKTNIDEPTSDHCGDLRTSTERVVNGVDSHDPSVVTLTEGNIASIGAVLATIPEGTMLCTGTLVGPDVVLTSAHCVRDTTTAIEFRVGRDFLDPVVTFAATQWHRHPGYDDAGGGAPDHDLAVIVLDGDTSAAGLEPIVISDTYMSILGMTVQAVGYGGTEDPEGNSLRKWTVQQVQLELPFGYSISDGGLSGLCAGDSGGPLLYLVPGLGVRVMGTAASISSTDCLGASNYSRTDTSIDWLEPRVPTGPCGLETAQGRCDGEVAIWCESDEVLSDDCAASDLHCGAGADGAYRCVDACTAFSEVGRCDDDVAIWCEEGIVKQRDCAACDQVCAMVGDPEMAYCLSP
jgi:hypothetical protein